MPDLDARIAGQQASIAELERALWDGGLNEALLPEYQAACRELEALRDQRTEQTGHDDRHHFVMLIPLADHPQRLHACLESLQALCQAYAYGGQADVRWRKVSVLLADDSRDPAAIRGHQEIGAEFNGRGLTTLYFGLEAQLALLDQLADLDLSGIIGRHDRGHYSHKGQAMMRNIAYLKLAQMQSRQAADYPPLLYYTLDAEQTFKVNAATARGDGEVCAVNYLHHLDEIFRRTDSLVLTGKLVGDPPVSPVVMAGNFLDDVLAFLDEMAASHPDQPYRRQIGSRRGSGAAVYHDMADLFGFNPAVKAFRYRCPPAGRDNEAPDNAACFSAFAQALNSFFHGQHPTRVTWYRPDASGVLGSLQAARTVYTSNYVFRPQALDWFIPFAPLRLRMSGPSMGRMMKAELDGRFVSANLPLLHTRPPRASGQSAPDPGGPRPGHGIALDDEFPHQFHGDVLLFALQHLTDLGFPGEALPDILVGHTLDTVRGEMTLRYRDKQQQTLARLERLNACLDDPETWWQRKPELAGARALFQAFAADMARNFGANSAGYAAIADDQNWRDWRPRLLAAINGYRQDRRVWNQALAILRDSAKA